MFEAPARAGTRFLNPATKVAKKTVLAPCASKVPLDPLHLRVTDERRLPQRSISGTPPTPDPKREACAHPPAHGHAEHDGQEPELRPRGKPSTDDHRQVARNDEADQECVLGDRGRYQKQVAV